LGNINTKTDGQDGQGGNEHAEWVGDEHGTDDGHANKGQQARLNKIMWKKTKK
jgi:hypothetical protein